LRSNHIDRNAVKLIPRFVLPQKESPFNNPAPRLCKFFRLAFGDRWRSDEDQDDAYNYCPTLSRLARRRLKQGIDLSLGSSVSDSKAQARSSRPAQKRILEGCDNFGAHAASQFFPCHQPRAPVCAASRSARIGSRGSHLRVSATRPSVRATC